MNFKEFKPTSWSINNKTSIYIITIIITFFGLSSYFNLPKESFPEIVIPTIYVSVPYPGTSPADMENLVARPIEKQLKSISGIKKVTSTSVQDFANVIAEFNTDVDVALAKQKVKDAVDKAKPDLPTDLPQEPQVVEIDFSEIPMLFINIYGDYDLDKLKKYAEMLEDRIEEMKQVTRVDIVGALEREIQINADMYKMQAARITFGDVAAAIYNENITMAGGQVKMDEMKRSIRVIGEFENVEQLKNIVIKSLPGNPVYLRDIAEVKDSYRERESYARLDHKNVITLNVIKRSGENLIEASDKIRDIISEFEKTKFPKDLKINLTGDQSEMTRTMLSDLLNSIVIGFILVVLVLMFFMGVTNAIFVALSVPLSSLIAFMFLPTIGFTMNMMVLFSFLFALGIIVDDAIVVIENTHRLFENGKRNILEAAKMAAGEVFVPVFAGTLTTLAPFIPLAFWQGIVGKFMFFMPITLIITLSASLLVAFIMNPVFAVSFMKPHNESKTFFTKGMKITTVIFLSIALIFYLNGGFGMGNLTVVLLLLVFINKLFVTKMVHRFETQLLPKLMNVYERVLRTALAHPIKMMFGTFALFIFTFVLMGIKSPPVVFFPQGHPNFAYAYISLPIGTDAALTDSITKIVENKIFDVVEKLEKENPIVLSIISNVGIGASDPMDGDRSISPHKGRVQVAFVKYADRHGKSSRMYLDKIREAVKGIPGAEITVDKEANGPPVGKPVNIEVSGDDFGDLITTSNALKKYLDSLHIAGVEELKSNLQNNKPEVVINIDREKANRMGVSTGQIASEIRTAVFGREVSKYREFEDEHPIQLRYKLEQRNNLDALINLIITFMDMNTGQIKQVPLSTVATIEYSSTYGAIKRKNMKRVVTISSNVLSGFNPNEVVAEVEKAMKNFKGKEGYEARIAGEQEEQKEAMNFLLNSLGISLGLIFLILVTQFNSTSKPFIILSEIIFSIIGVLLGFTIFGIEISIVMTGIGIVGLAGIVVKNGILLVEFSDELKRRGLETKEAVVQAGRIRLKPVLLTAATTILGLVPMAVGFNIDFVGLFTEFNPHIFFGGDSVVFWGPLSWSIIFGLGFATFLTLILVPVMYYLDFKAKVFWKTKLLLMFN